MGDEDYLNPFKKPRKLINIESELKGKMGEEEARQTLIKQGYDVQRTGRGSDFFAVKKDLNGKVIESKLVEVKTGQAKLSPLQVKTQAKTGKNYVVIRKNIWWI